MDETGAHYSQILILADSRSPFSYLLKYHLFKEESHRELGNRLVNLHVCVHEIKPLYEDLPVCMAMTAVSCVLFL